LMRQSARDENIYLILRDLFLLTCWFKCFVVKLFLSILFSDGLIENGYSPLRIPTGG
jgi:hypothetical protein